MGKRKEETTTVDDGNGTAENEKPKLVTVILKCRGCGKTTQFEREPDEEKGIVKPVNEYAITCTECKKKIVDAKADSLVGRKIGQRYVGARLSQFKGADKIKEFVESHLETLSNFHISGPEGVGKTHLSCALIHYLIGRMSIRDWGDQIIWSKASDYYDIVRASDEWSSVINVPVLFVDELVTRGAYAEEVGQKIYDVIDERYSRQRITITLANYTIEEIRDGGTPYGSKLGRLIASKMTRDNEESQITLSEPKKPKP